jgi:hypothetical protein
MKKATAIFGALLITSIILTSCGGSPDDTTTDANVLKPTPNVTYSLQDALTNNFVKISADGKGTYRSIGLNLENNTDANISVSLPAGIYFENPDNAAQSLITAQKYKSILLNNKQKISLDVASFCTNVKQKVPGVLKDWRYESNYDGGLDEVIEFYGKYETGINEWLEKKNKRFSTEENRLLFFQTVIWYHEGGQYSEILGMLENDVFKNDIEQSKLWLDEIHEDANELAQLIRERDSQKIKSWLKQKTLELLPTSEQIDNTVDKAKKRLDRIRDRLNNN